MRHGMLKAFVKAAQNVVDEVAVLDAGAKIAQRVGHLLHPGGVVDDGEVPLVEAVEVVEEVRGVGVAVAAEERSQGAPEGKRRVLAVLDDLQSRGRPGGDLPENDGEIVENPVGGALRW